MNNHEERLRFERFWVENFEPDTFDDVEYSEILNTYDSNYIITDDLNRSWLAWQARAKAQAVPEVITIGNELQSWVAVWSFRAKNDGEDYVVVDANLLAEKIEKLTGANA